MIEIRAFYGEWKPASAEQAVKFIEQMISGFSAIKGYDEKLKRINEHHLRGITAQELLCQKA